MQKDKVLQLYYFATPVFFLVDKLWGFNVRVTLPPEIASLQSIYYAVCLAGAFLFFKNQKAAEIFSLAECSINILLLLLSVMLPVAMLGETDTPQIVFGPARLVHFMIAGGFLAISFYRNPLLKGTY